MRKLRLLVAMAATAVLALAVAGPAAAKDKNHDKIPDKWEKRYHLSLKKKQGRRDQDRDGAKNRAEFKAKTNPRRADTDRDGTPDGDENAGTIASYDPDTGELVIDLFGGDSVSGIVDENTEVECGCRGDSEDDDSAGEERRHPGEDEPGDDDGEDDHGGPGPEGPGHEGPGHGGSGCTVDDLVVGAVVHEAELKATADGLVYTEIELVKDDPAGDDEDDDSSDD